MDADPNEVAKEVPLKLKARPLRFIDPPELTVKPPLLFKVVGPLIFAVKGPLTVAVKEAVFRDKL